MNWLDVLIAFMITLPTYFGFRKGFIRKLLGISGLIAGFILAVKFYPSLSTVLSKLIKEDESFIHVISFLLIIGFIFGLSLWIARFIADINSGTRITDKVLGSIFGFIQGILFSSILLYNLALVNIPSNSVRNSSLFYSRVVIFAPLMFDKILQFFPGLKELYNEYNIPFDDRNNKEKK
ncbi:MAG: CvpA family protein [Ignavibacteria bacterium]|nr:CvpA family protein [Ignavibacteria bacterium]